MKATYITLKDGCRIFAEYSIKNYHDRTIIYVHGGPGQGCWDFRYAAQELSKKFNIIMYDQRGVLRSDSINDNFNSNMLIDDIEEIRKYFNINKIVLCGHSYGAQLIIRYALKYSKYIHSIIYVCPSFNFKLSLINIFKLWQNFTDNMKDSKIINLCLEKNDEKLYLKYLFQMPNDIRNKIYYTKDLSDDINSKINNINVVTEDWLKGAKQQEKIFNEKHIYYDYLQQLSKITINSLLLVGEYDPICCEIQQKSFLNYPYTQKIIIKNSGHSVYNDNTKDFIQSISTFLKQNNLNN